MLLILLAAALMLAAVPSLARAEPALHTLVTDVARAHGVPSALAHAVVRTESGYRCGAAAGGSIGIMQVKPATARSVGVGGNLRDCATGLSAGMRYLAQALARGGGLCVAASAYNRGIFARPACTAYGRLVLSRMRRAT